MATCFENIVKHFQFVIRQLEQLKHQDKVPEEQEEKIWELLSKIEDYYYSLPFGQAERKALFTGLAVPIRTVKFGSGEAVRTKHNFVGTLPLSVQTRN